MIKVSFIIVVCLNAVYSSNLHKTEAQAKHGDDCSLFNWCEGDLKCHDYRCLNETELQNATDLPRAPEGNVCDWFHHCKDGYHCENHRCSADNGTNTTNVGDHQSKTIENKQHTEVMSNQTGNATEIKPQARKEGETLLKEDSLTNQTESQKEEIIRQEEPTKNENETNIQHKQEQPIEQHTTKEDNEDNKEPIPNRTMTKHKTTSGNNQQQNSNSTNISEEK